MFSGRLALNLWSRTLRTTRAARNIKSTACTSPVSATPTAARLAAVDAQLAVLQAERAVLQAAVFAETFPAWARARAAKAAATGSLLLDGDAGLRGFADVLAAHMVAPPKVTRFEETAKYYDLAVYHSRVLVGRRQHPRLAGDEPLPRERVLHGAHGQRLCGPTSGLE